MINPTNEIGGVRNLNTGGVSAEDTSGSSQWRSHKKWRKIRREFRILIFNSHMDNWFDVAVNKVIGVIRDVPE